MPENDEAKSFSVSLRLRRTRSEYTYVSVPVTMDLMETDSGGNVKRDGQGKSHIDMAKFVRKATEMASSTTVSWIPEEETEEPHPIQNAPGPQGKSH